MTRVQYLRRKILLDDAVDCPPPLLEAVVSDMLKAHPEWDTKELRAWVHWEQQNGKAA
jgi:hypothetical protein